MSYTDTQKEEIHDAIIAGLWNNRNKMSHKELTALASSIVESLSGLTADERCEERIQELLTAEQKKSKAPITAYEVNEIREFLQAAPHGKYSYTSTHSTVWALKPLGFYEYATRWLGGGRYSYYTDGKLKIRVLREDIRLAPGSPHLYQCKTEMTVVK